MLTIGSGREEVEIDYDGISKLMDVREVDGEEEFLAHFIGNFWTLTIGMPCILASADLHADCGKENHKQAVGLLT